MNQGRIKIQMNFMQENECIQNINFHLAFYSFTCFYFKTIN